MRPAARSKSLAKVRLRATWRTFVRMMRIRRYRSDRLKEGNGMDPEVKALFQMVLEGQYQTDKSIGNLATVTSSMIEAVTSLTATVNSMAITVNSMAITVDQYVQA